MMEAGQTDDEASYVARDHHQSVDLNGNSHGHHQLTTASPTEQRPDPRPQTNRSTNPPAAVKGFNSNKIHPLDWYSFSYYPHRNHAELCQTRRDQFGRSGSPEAQGEYF